jgi:rare lipoprotein A
MRNLVLALLSGVLLLGSGCASKAQPNTYSTYAEVGQASYYGVQWHGRTTANGERMNIHAMTAAHKTLPFHTRVRVTMLSTGKSVVVRINDRGPFVKGRIIDLSDEAAKRIGLLGKGLAKVRIEVLN